MSGGKFTTHPIMPLEATEERRNHFWNSRNAINTGRMIILAKAIMSPQCRGDWPKKTSIPTISER